MCVWATFFLKSERERRVVGQRGNNIRFEREREREKWYRVTMVVVHLGWVDSDLGSSPAGGLLLQLSAAQLEGRTS